MSGFVFAWEVGVRRRRWVQRCSAAAAPPPAPAEERRVKQELARLEVKAPESLRFSSKWRSMVENLEGMELTGPFLRRLLKRQPALLELDPMETIVPFVRTVTTVLDFDSRGASILLCRRPSLMFHPEVALAEVLSMLLALGADERDLRFLLLRFPGIAELNPRRVGAAVQFLVEEVGFTPADLWTVVRHSPWILCYDVKEEMAPTIEYLQEISVRNPKTVVRGEARVFGCAASGQLEDVYAFLLGLGLSKRDIPPVLELFPCVLIASVEEKLSPNAEFLRALGLSRGALARAVRAFPQILVLDAQAEMSAVVSYLEASGVTDVAGVIARVPALLDYDVEADIRPKVNFLLRVGYTMEDIVEFPGCLTSSLDGTMVPRLAFLRSLGRGAKDVRLAEALGGNDEQFCERIAFVAQGQYTNFASELATRRGLGRRGARRKRRSKGGKRRTFPTRCRFPVAELFPQR